MIRVHQVITKPAEGAGLTSSRWFKDSPFSTLLQKIEQADPEAYGRGDSVTILTIWLAESDVEIFTEANNIVWHD